MQQGSPRLTVVVPVYNEHSTLEEIIRRVQAVDIDKEIVVVDDGSTDGSREILQRLVSGGGANDIRHDNIRAYYQPRNRGKGAALHRGFREARGEVVLVQDADLELDPSDYPALMAPIDEGQADVVFGTRYGGEERGIFWAYYAGVKATTLLTNALTGLRLTDVWTGYKVFRREVIERLTLIEERFGFEPEVAIKVAKAGWRIVEVPVGYQGRTHDDGKKIRAIDGVRGVLSIFRYRFFG